MAGEEIQLGPFVGGLNTYSDPTAISDTSLAEIVNFEMDEDGALTNRPPFQDLGTPIPNGGAGGAGFKILGFYSGAGSTRQLIATNGVDATYTYNGTTWTLLASRVFSSIVQYRDELWLICKQGGGQGGKWTPNGGFVEVANIPRGEAIISHKDRLWVASGKTATSNGSRLYMSTIVSAAVEWPVTPVFINVGAGDGQNIVDVTVYNSDLVIFKEASTYRFSYMADPARGELRRISSTIGISSTGCFAEHENSIYLLFSNKVYMFVNYNFEELNSKVPLRAISPTENLWEKYSLSIWADRLIVQFYDQMYVYKLKTRTWSVWSTEIPSLRFIGRFWYDPASPPGYPRAYVASSEFGKASLFRVSEEVTSARESYDIVCRITTKNYDYDTPSRFKRLFYWGVDVIANVSLTLVVKPISYGRRATWNEMAQFTWDEVADNTWDQPLTRSLEIKEVVPVEGLSFGRKFVKGVESLRFRQVAFSVEGITRGDSLTSPLKVFSLTTYVSDKQSVSKKIS